MLVIYKVLKEGSVGWPTTLFLALILEDDLLIAPRWSLSWKVFGWIRNLMQMEPLPSGHFAILLVITEHFQPAPWCGKHYIWSLRVDSTEPGSDILPTIIEFPSINLLPYLFHVYICPCIDACKYYCWYVHIPDPQNNRTVICTV